MSLGLPCSSVSLSVSLSLLVHLIEPSLFQIHVPRLSPNVFTLWLRNRAWLDCGLTFCSPERVLIGEHCIAYPAPPSTSMALVGEFAFQPLAEDSSRQFFKLNQGKELEQVIKQLRAGASATFMRTPGQEGVLQIGDDSYWLDPKSIPSGPPPECLQYNSSDDSFQSLGAVTKAYRVSKQKAKTSRATTARARKPIASNPRTQPQPSVPIDRSESSLRSASAEGISISLSKPGVASKSTKTAGSQPLPPRPARPQFKISSQEEYLKKCEEFRIQHQEHEHLQQTQTRITSEMQELQRRYDRTSSTKELPKLGKLIRQEYTRKRPEFDNNQKRLKQLHAALKKLKKVLRDFEASQQAHSGPQ
eukprot:m.77142 g.77142  ORF g.77142 m.77142 type:complete len:361 (+) comp12503_c0_seq1:200-1282(+)